MSVYWQIIPNVLPDGLTLMQVGRDGAGLLAADLRQESSSFGWLFSRHADGQWVTSRKLSSAEIEEAYDQAADFNVLVVENFPDVRSGGR